MRSAEAIVFDLDDTILDDSSAVAQCWDQACREAAASTAGLDPRALLAAIALQRDWFWSDPDRHRIGRLDLRAATTQIVDNALRSLGYKLPEKAAAIARRYRDLREERVTVLPGAIETLQWFRNRGVRLGMATNGSSVGQRAKIERFGLASFFDRIIVEEEFGVGKPHTDVYKELFDALDATPRNTWFVGDNLEIDVQTPQSLGAYTVWVNRAASAFPPDMGVRPDRIVRTIAELCA